MSRKQIDNKWNDMVDRGRERAVVSKKNGVLKVSSETVTTTVTTGRTWTSVEHDVLMGILTGPEGLLKEGTIPKNVFQCAAAQCKMRRVKRTARACRRQWQEVLSPQARKRSRGIDTSSLSIAQSTLVRQTVKKLRREGTLVPMKALATRLNHTQEHLRLMIPRVLKSPTTLMAPSVAMAPQLSPSPSPSPSPTPQLSPSQSPAVSHLTPKPDGFPNDL